MKKCLKVLWLFLFISFYCFSYAQESNKLSSPILITENFVNTPLAEVLSLLKKKYQLKIAYDNSTVEKIIVNQKIHQLELKKALGKICSNTVLTFEVVSPKQVLIWEDKDYEFTPILTKVEYMNFKGRLIDAETLEPLGYATIHSIPGNKNCTSDEDGRFSMEVPKVEGVAVSIRFIGYETQMVDANKLNPTIHLHPQSHSIGEVEVVGQLPTISLVNDEGYIRLSPNGLSNITPSITKDLFRQIQLLPGIAAHDDFSADLVVRGGNGDENMVLLDGMTLYNVSHFFGVFSNVNSNIVKDVKIYKNAFPAEYGGRTSSVIDISTLENKSNKIKGGLTADFLTTSLHAQIPITEKVDLLLGGRFTNQNIAKNELFGLLEKSNSQAVEIRDPRRNRNSNLLLFSSNDSDFQFNDWNAKLSAQLNDQLSATASFFLGNDAFSYSYMETIPLQNREVGINSTEEVKWNNQGFNLTLQNQWNEQWASQLSISNSNYNLDDQITSQSFRIIGTDSTHQSWLNEVTGTQISLKNTYRTQKNSELNIGYQLLQNQTSFNVNIYDLTHKLENNRVRTSIKDKKYEINEEAVQHSLYVQYQAKLLDQKFQYSIGLRTTHYELTEDFYFSPRAQLGFRPNEEFRFKASASRYYQFLQQAYREDRFGRSYDYWSLATLNADARDNRLTPFETPVTPSNHFMLGFNWMKGKFTIDIEAYQKNTFDIIEQALTINSAEQINVEGIPEVANFKGDRRTRGIDVLLKQTSSNYDTWMAYTLSKTENRFSLIQNNEYFPAQTDRRHQINWVNNFKFGAWEFSGTYIFASGAPVTDITLLSKESRERGQINFDERTIYLEDYHRVDIGAAYRFPIRRANAKISLSIFNLFDRQNVKYRQYFTSIANNLEDKNNIIGTDVQMLGVTPNLSFSIDF